MTYRETSTRVDGGRPRGVSLVAAETLPSGLRLVTEQMPDVRSVTVGIWLKCGSRHESDAEGGVSHFLEHMLFKGTTSRSAREIAEAVDSLGGQMDAFTTKEYVSYSVKVLDEHLPVAIDLLSDLVLRPALAPGDVEREQSVILEEIKMVEDAPEDLVHEMFAETFWTRHPLGRPILGTPATVLALTADTLRHNFERMYVSPNAVIAVAGHFVPERVRDLVSRAFEAMPTGPRPLPAGPPEVRGGVAARRKEIEQSHICLGAPAYPQGHEDRYVLYVLNTVLGGSMSSRLFQHIREDRGLAYAVYSNLATYSDAGMFTI
jgi:predicted Zn-dependent peptidase